MQARLPSPRIQAKFNVLLDCLLYQTSNRLQLSKIAVPSRLLSVSRTPGNGADAHYSRYYCTIVPIGRSRSVTSPKRCRAALRVFSPMGESVYPEGDFSDFRS